jgi:hypothetical protein
VRRKRVENVQKRKYETLLKELTGEMDIQRVSADEAGKVMGTSRGTFYRRINNPEEFQIGELLKLCNYLGFPIEKTRSLLHYK